MQAYVLLHVKSAINEIFQMTLSYVTLDLKHATEETKNENVFALVENH